MKFTVSFLEPAEKEIFDTISFYNGESSGLGFEFALEVQKAIERIIKFPESWTKLSARTRKYRCNRFPYNINYNLEKSSIVIVAIMHSKRKPHYWQKRIENN